VNVYKNRRSLFHLFELEQLIKRWKSELSQKKKKKKLRMASRSASNNNNNRAELLLVIEPKQGEEKKKVQKYYVTVPVKESSIKKISGFDECFLVEKERKEAIVAENGYFLLKDYVGKQYIIYGRKWREDSFEDVRENESSENQSQKDEELEEYEFVKNNVRECENGNIWTHSYYYVWDKASIIASNLPTLSEISALTGVPFDDVLSLQFAPSDLTSALMDYWNGSQESEEEKLTKELERIVTLDNLLEKNLREGQPQIKDLTSIKIWEVTKSIQNLISEEKEFFGINKEFNTCLNQSFEFAKNKGPNSEVRCVIEIAYSLSLSLTNPMDTFSSDLSSSSLASPSSAQYRSVIQFLQQKLSYIHTITSENFFPVSEPSNSNSIQSLLKKYSTSIINELLPYFEAKYGESLKNEKSDILSRLRESKQQNEDQKRILEEFKMKINNLQDQINSIENQKSNLKFVSLFILFYFILFYFILFYLFVYF